MGKLQEQLLRNSTDIYIGQNVRIIDEDVLKLYSDMVGPDRPKALIGRITDIDGEDVKVDIRVSINDYPSPYTINLGGWNIDFSTNVDV